jgi:hypothetical protein
VTNPVSEIRLKSNNVVMLRGEKRNVREITLPSVNLQLYIPDGLVWDRTRNSAVRDRRQGTSGCHFFEKNCIYHFENYFKKFRFFKVISGMK